MPKTMSLKYVQGIQLMQLPVSIFNISFHFRNFLYIQKECCPKLMLYLKLLLSHLHNQAIYH